MTLKIEFSALCAFFLEAPGQGYRIPSEPPGETQIFKKLKAFTLIEVLVVVAIAAILLALVVPVALHHGPSAGQSTDTCSAQHRHLLGAAPSGLRAGIPRP